MSEKQSAVTYPTVEQYAEWKRRADALDMGVSGYMRAMIEAGAKKFDASTVPDETNQELREQRNDMREELAQARERINRLEDLVHGGERAEIKRFIRENPGTSWEEVVEDVTQTAGHRVTDHLDAMDGEDLRIDDGRYYVRGVADE